jgi:predicted lipoprotein with Yx(FWY)xxD motif
MTRHRTSAGIALLCVAAAVGLAGCGGGTDTTVSARNVSGVGTVLVDQAGHALYSPEQEADGTILCTATCASIWIPLGVPSGQMSPTATDDLASRVGVVKRPDGSEQVTFDGKPLYTFVEDRSPGAVTGNGFEDSFGATSFTWRVVGPGPVSTGTTPGTQGYGY